ncbi:MAG: permease [Clostridiales bacterium]|nr:permease [Clostridiales bacterium]
MIMKKIKKHKRLVLVTLSYLGLFIFAPDIALTSANNSVYYLLEMLQVLPVIFLLTILIDAWVPKELITKKLGAKSGFSGNLFSILLGSLSAGPIYAAFPLSKLLLKKGASVANIVIILSSWAVIKVPMLLNEAKFLGVNFMIVRWVLTVITILFMGYIISLFVKKEDILNSNDASISNTSFKINKQHCIGCGICARVYPEYFEMNNDKAKVKSPIVTKDNKKIIEASIDECPVNAISLNHKK